MFKKNAAVTGFTFGLVSATDGSDVTTGTPTGVVTLDGGTQTTIVGTPVHEGNGQWSVNLTAAETNGTIIGLAFKVTGALTTHFTIKTDTVITSDLNDFNPALDTVATVTSLTNAIVLPSIPTNWITSTGIAATALNGKGDWNIGKTGYTLTQVFPTNFSSLAITATTGLITVGTNNDKLGYSIQGTKTTLDALNDITATSIVSNGAINTLTGSIQRVTLVDTTTINTDMITPTSIWGYDVTTTAVGANKAGNVVQTIATDTTTDIPALIAALNNLSSAQIKTAVLTALADPTTEPTAIPATTASIIDKLSYLFAYRGNKINQTATAQTLRNRSDTLNISSATVSSDGTTTTRGTHL